MNITLNMYTFIIYLRSFRSYTQRSACTCLVNTESVAIVKTVMLSPFDLFQMSRVPFENGCQRPRRQRGVPYQRPVLSLPLLYPDEL